MPIYQYLCSNCKGVFEVMSSMKEMNTPRPCPLCKSTETQKTLSSFSVGKSCPTSHKRCSSMDSCPGCH